MRVTNQTLSFQVTDWLQQALRRVAEAQEAVASGRRINRFSDDPLGAARVLDLHSLNASFEQYDKNINNGLSVLEQNDAVLGQVTEVLGRARELALAMVNDSNSSQDRTVAANEIGQLLQQLLSLANTKVGNSYLFGGFKNGAAPFAQGTGVVTYSGDGGQISTQISSSTTLTLNLPGNQVFQGAGVTGGAGLFDILQDLQTVLNSNNNVSPVSLAVRLAVNLDATATTPGTPFPAGPDDTPTNWLAASNFSTVVTTFDSLGTAHNLTLLFRKTGATSWDYRVVANRKELDAAAPTSTDLRQVSSGTLNFTGAGALTTSTINAVGPMAWVNGSTSQTIAATDLKFTGSTQLAKPSAVNTLSQTNTNSLTTQIGRLDAALEQILSFRAQVGGRLNTAQTMKEGLSLMKTQTESLRSEIEDADALQAYSDFARLQHAFEAALQSASRVIQPTLLDFLR